MHTPISQSPPRIDPGAVYSDGDLRLMLGVSSAALARARRSGQLRYSRPGRSVLYRGQWVIDWLEGDANQRPQRHQEEAA